MIRNKIYDEAKILEKYNLVLDAIRFQKAQYEVSPEWLHETKERKNDMVFINKRYKHRNYSNQNPNTLRQIINDILYDI